MKIVINDGERSYGLSKEAYDYLGLDWEKEVIWPLERTRAGLSKEIVPAGMAYKKDRANPKLIEVVQVLGQRAGIDGTFLTIFELRDGASYLIEDRPLGGENLILVSK